MLFFFIKLDILVTNCNKHRPFIPLLQFVLRGSITFIAEFLMVINIYAPIKQHVASSSGRAV
jgi:hypothetical protein